MFRQANDTDMAGVREIATHFELLSKWPQRPDFLDREELFVASSGPDVVGFAGTFRRGDLTHLGDLFVLPSAQSTGIGGGLLRLALPAGPPRITYASSDPRAIAAYRRIGLGSLGFLMYLSGRVAAAAGEIAPAIVSDVADLDRAVSGGDRLTDLSWYAALPGTRVWASDSAYVMTREVGDSVVVGPAGGGDATACTSAVLAAMGQLAPASFQIAVFGTHPLLAALLAAGLTIHDQDTVMASAPGLLAMDRYVPHPDLG